MEDYNSEMRNITFNNLALEEQARQIFLRGHYVNKISFFQLSISLFRINDEFVEIWYNTLTGTIRKIEPLQNRAINPFIKHLFATSPN